MDLDKGSPLARVNPLGPPKQHPSPTTNYDDLFDKAYHGAQVCKFTWARVRVRVMIDFCFGSLISYNSHHNSRVQSRETVPACFGFRGHPNNTQALLQTTTTFSKRRGVVRRFVTFVGLGFGMGYNCFLFVCISLISYKSHHNSRVQSRETVPA